MIGTLSLGKIILLVAVIGVVLWLMRTRARSKAASTAVPRGNPRTVELIACPRCGTFMPKGNWCTCDRK
jgi:uncharacterized SAM-binding protein YcdF (DUF218 family)